MPVLSDIVNRLSDLTPQEKYELGRKLDWFESVIAGVSGQINKAIGSLGFSADTPGGGKFIGIFNTSCPAGWTRVTGLDNKFIRGATSYGGTGGANTHTHTGANTSAEAAHTHPSGASTAVASGAGTNVRGVEATGVNTGAGSSHAHGSGLSTEDNIPAYVNVVFCSKD